jgi:hypothetical protein
VNTAVLPAIGAVTVGTYDEYVASIDDQRGLSDYTPIIIALDLDLNKFA